MSGVKSWHPMWTCEASGKSVEQAADLFCASYWDRARERGQLVDGMFSLVDGSRIYRVRLNTSVKPQQYIIERPVY